MFDGARIVRRQARIGRAAPHVFDYDALPSRLVPKGDTFTMASKTRPDGSLARLALIGGVALALSLPAFAQAPAAGAAPADDTPSIKVGVTIFADTTYQAAPEATNAAGTYNPSSFNITRGYINVTGKISHRISFRVTPDVRQETKAVLPNGTPIDVNGSYVYRLKYAYGQLSLEDWLPKGSWVRLGLQPTPYPGYMDDIYRYRFQGAAFTDRERFLSTSDAGLTSQIAFPHDYGEVHFGLYNGEGYQSVETNNQKAFQIRANLCPAPETPVVKGLKFAVFGDLDHYLRDQNKQRILEAVTFEHDRVNAGFEYFGAKDEDSDKRFPVPSAAFTEITSKGWSVWVTPKLGKGFEALLRRDDYTPDKTKNAEKIRTIAGIAYWPRVQKGVSTTVMLDYEHVAYDDYVTVVSDPAKAPKDETRWAIHLQLSI
jgi:hypothetical protein